MGISSIKQSLSRAFYFSTAFISERTRRIIQIAQNTLRTVDNRYIRRLAFLEFFSKSLCVISFGVKIFTDAAFTKHPAYKMLFFSLIITTVSITLLKKYAIKQHEIARQEKVSGDWNIKAVGTDSH